MKIYEVLEKYTMPHLFLDMDGVQADFFGRWAEEHGVSNYKQIPHPEEAIQELATSSPERVYNFFRELQPLPGGMRLINWLKTNKIPFTVLSAPLRGPYASSSIKAKKDWLDQYNPGTSDSAIFTSAKYKHAKDGGTTNVLVDDFGKYLSAWEQAGGIPVKHEDGQTNKTIEMLKDIYKDYLNKGIQNG
jgi:hypothetical protein